MDSLGTFDSLHRAALAALHTAVDRLTALLSHDNPSIILRAAHTLARICSLTPATPSTPAPNPPSRPDRTHDRAPASEALESTLRDLRALEALTAMIGAAHHPEPTSPSLVGRHSVPTSSTSTPPHLSLAPASSPLPAGQHTRQPSSCVRRLSPPPSPRASRGEGASPPGEADEGRLRSKMDRSPAPTSPSFDSPTSRRATGVGCFDPSPVHPAPSRSLIPDPSPRAPPLTSSSESNLAPTSPFAPPTCRPPASTPSPPHPCSTAPPSNQERSRPTDTMPQPAERRRACSS
jgi:hypothetical protein